MAAEDRNGEAVSTEREVYADCSTSESSFDALAKGLANGKLSRSRALRMLGGALVGGALASVPGVAWAKKCQPLLHKCTANTQCCSRNCIKNPNGNGRICGCPTGQTLCSNKCITCNNTGEVVNPSTCQCECPTGQVVCNNACVSRDCSGGKVFNATTCQCECPAGEELCGGQCVTSCSGGRILNATTCQCECPTGTTLCPGNNTCVETCPSGQTLNLTTCQCEGTCPAGAPSCDGTCCPGNGPSGCGCEGGCACFVTAEGTQACTSAACYRSDGFTCDQCNSTAQCPAGFTCVFDVFLLRQLGLCPGATTPTTGGITCNSNADCPTGTACVATSRENTKYCCTAGVCFHNCSLTTPPLEA